MAEIEPAIMEHEATVQALEQQLHDPAVSSDHRKLHDVATKLSEAQAKVAQLYERWEQLEAKQRGE